MTQPRSQPSPASRLAERLDDLPPAACRALLEALDRQASHGGGEVAVTLIVAASGRVRAAQVAVWYESETGGAT
jgi:hypothetical protein